jgi:hypothetical protein
LNSPAPQCHALRDARDQRPGRAAVGDGFSGQARAF